MRVGTSVCPIYHGLIILCNPERLWLVLEILIGMWSLIPVNSASFSSEQCFFHQGPVLLECGLFSCNVLMKSDTGPFWVCQNQHDCKEISCEEVFYEYALHLYILNQKWHQPTIHKIICAILYSLWRWMLWCDIAIRPYNSLVNQTIWGVLTHVSSKKTKKFSSAVMYHWWERTPCPVCCLGLEGWSLFEAKEFLYHQKFTLEQITIIWSQSSKSCELKSPIMMILGLWFTSFEWMVYRAMNLDSLMNPGSPTWTMCGLWQLARCTNP